jgi:hypothetical protein
MKKTILLIFLIGFVLTALPQGLRLNGYAGYMFNDSFQSSYKPNTFLVGMINGGDQWGAGLDHMIKPGYCIEVQYLHHTTEVLYTYQLGVSTPAKSESTELTIDCTLIGSDGHLQRSSGKVEGYGGLFIGSAHLRSSNSSTAASRVADKFSLSEKRPGCNDWFLEKAGLKLQTQFLSFVRGTDNDVSKRTNANN